VGKEAIVSVGQLIKHKLFHYRGVVIDVDPVFMLSDEWYEEVAKSRPPKDEPWYHVLVHNSSQQTYVAQRNLEPDDSGEPIVHPNIDEHFSSFSKGRYYTNRKTN
jgi:heat shock protein HspQ